MIRVVAVRITSIFETDMKTAGRTMALRDMREKISLFVRGGKLILIIMVMQKTKIMHPKIIGNLHLPMKIRMKRAVMEGVSSNH